MRGRLDLYGGALEDPRLMLLHESITGALDHAVR